MGRRVWFITDASSALGRSMTEQVLRSGDVAVAALNRPSEIFDLVEKYGANVLLPTKLDAFDRTQVFAALACAKEVFGRIDVVFNNAGDGVSAQGEPWWDEDEEDENVDAVSDGESWAVANVTWEAVRFFREVNSPKVAGTIVQMAAPAHHERSSVTGELSRLMDATWNVKLWLVDDDINQRLGQFMHYHLTERLFEADASPRMLVS
ncbi:hypothetical protein CONPUDRAFT_169408 [Coniophora puteana RWD-64-598 SS2]|uniref:NAD(P)-binding protein n=1 Tax=Coniophora puteana (strain RWD-64-598) TaxID=741705 RepID=A0A5M3MAE9_CONPW|nr:uncharacterized protein CONPUDRAFT_169408 [Coniophora puteana RWD-64-598 SS2]EIW75621.1 hypothetical protein CONPUDRAFT_169408 [Coniophora puteana RWD-64-598 SS2]